MVQRVQARRHFEMVYSLEYCLGSLVFATLRDHPGGIDSCLVPPPGGCGPEYSHTPVVTSLCLLELRCAQRHLPHHQRWHHGERLVNR
jgi:hypothetical protein